MTRRTALITGASAGIGAEFAVQLADQGLDLVLVARRTQRLQTMADSLAEQHAIRVHVITEDLSDLGAAQRIFEQTERLGLSIDYLVNNAGGSGPDLLADRAWDHHEAFHRLMITSVAQMCHLYLPGMKQRGYGRVVNVASIAGLVATPGGANYGPAKRYVIGLSEELHMILRPFGVNVTALCPGFTDTEFHDGGGLEEMKRRIPRFLWYSTSVVVKDGRYAVERGKAVQVTGRLYRIALPLVQSRIGSWMLRRFR